MIIIKRQGDNAMDYRRALPFYHAYSQYGDLGQMDADAVAGDLEYLQQMYPSYAKNIRFGSARCWIVWIMTGV